MKTIVLLFLTCVCGFGAFSQDTLYTKNGRVINAKVTEVNPDAIKYKKATNPDGPTYVISKSDVTLIQYQNGSKDVFSEDGSDDSNSGSQSLDNAASSVVYNYGPFWNWFGGGWFWGSPGVSVVVGSPCIPWVWSGWNGFWGWGNGWHHGGHHGGGHSGRRH
jgi:hypothetical protein